MEARSREILYNEGVAPGYFRLGLRWKGAGIRPGHFVMVRVSDGLDPLLRRPLGVYRVGHGTVELLYAVVGKGTEILSKKMPGESVDLLGPLGNGFTLPAKGHRAVLVAGGMGIVPLYMLAKKVKKSVLLFGARSAKEASVADDFKGLGINIKIATNDGSVGKKGLVTDLLQDEIRPGDIIYACGPVGMLKKIATIAAHAGVSCQVSLERSMACGIGVCLGCAVKASSHKEASNRNYRMVCSEGPVFDSEDIDWERL
ncbi:MAG: dihydroorotate dehydrogenase electron transfer subunit [Deltaproteobacteria bacterium]